jgi:hypothetical protein
MHDAVGLPLREPERGTNGWDDRCPRDRSQQVVEQISLLLALFRGNS